MSAVGALLGLILWLFWIVLIARVILDWSVVLAGPPAWGGFRAKAINVVTRITEPVLAPVRKIVPPLRVGGISIDLAFILVFFAVVILRGLVSAL
ncbi:YggT family protein [Cryptosporangium aurantiacum]|uniref:YggT family protein n=1 Tax=Cryptosporangium aurantiacum TaxID=134849 RepID=A0A1M7RMX4_9ACTN|nr:YggT family protein [Cryptosporangium aurantiacum]SHN47551.1 YggT family protein [Cryptosporangium aurantiacum]